MVERSIRRTANSDGLEAALKRLTLEYDQLDALRRCKHVAWLLIEQYRLMELYVDASERDRFAALMDNLEETLADADQARLAQLQEARERRRTG
jgi:hypothetical protein